MWIKKSLSTRGNKNAQFVLQSMLTLCVCIYVCWPLHFTIWIINIYKIVLLFENVSTFILQSEMVWRDIRIAQNSLINASKLATMAPSTPKFQKKKKTDSDQKISVMPWVNRWLDKFGYYVCVSVYLTYSVQKVDTLYCKLKKMLICGMIINHKGIHTNIIIGFSERNVIDFLFCTVTANSSQIP